MKMSRLAVLFAIIAIILAAVTATSTVWPRPKFIKYMDKTEYLITNDTFTFTLTGVQNDVLTAAIKRYISIIFSHRLSASVEQRQRRLDGRQLDAPSPQVTGCTIKVAKEGLPSFREDESYTIDTTANPTCVITANTTTGALRALETFSQLVDRNGYLTAAVVQDSPRYEVRAFMIDTARHWYPLNVIYQHIDAMAYSKFNTLHWHIVDDQSFPFQSTTFPEMSAQGAFSPRHVYTHSDIQDVIKYAQYRGITVVPEFDSPGHVTRGYQALKPSILTPCPTANSGVLNPIIDETYEFLDKFYDEIRALFTAPTIHLGGDEVIHSCWAKDASIQAWMAKHPEIPNYTALEQYYIRKLIEIVNKGGRYPNGVIVWEEVFTNGAKLPPGSIVEIWKEEGWRDTVARVEEAGYGSLLIAPWYLNYISYGPDWKKYYQTEPGEIKGLIGIAAAMWSEYVDASNFIPRSWPRAAAVSERGWSPREVNDIVDAQNRIHEFRCKLLARGINAQPAENGADIKALDGKTFCHDEWNPRYIPPF